MIKVGILRLSVFSTMTVKDIGGQVCEEEDRTEFNAGTRPLSGAAPSMDLQTQTNSVQTSSSPTIE